MVIDIFNTPKQPVVTVSRWPGLAKHDSRLLAEKRPFAEPRDRKFRQHHQWPVLADLDEYSVNNSHVFSFSLADK